VIPLAEKSEFARPKNKFLFLAYQGIAVCYMNQGLYAQAEQVFLKLMDYLPTWPGLDDLEYPAYLRHLGTAQMKQEHWQAAEESLQKSISVCDSQIEKALKADSRLAPAEQAGYARAEKARSIMYLAAAYTRQGRMADALAAADKAYDTATQANVPPDDLNSIVKTGIEIALVSKDQDAMMKWSRRVPDQK
jgi:tetratricopeptide (TPR) repeat protein